MKKIKYLIITSLFLFIGCTSQKNFSPTISQDTLAVILYEMHLYRSYYLKNQGNLHPPNDSLYSQALREVLKKHQVTSQQFLTALQEYFSYPDSMKALYEKILDITTHELAQVDVEEKKKVQGILHSPKK